MKRGNFLRLRLRNKVKVESNNTLSIAKSSRIRQCNISIKGFGNKLLIDDNVNIRRSHIEIDGNNCLIHIKGNSTIGQNCYLSAREKNINLVVGEDCMFSRNVKIMTSDGHNIIKEGKRINFAKSINIGSHVWLADNVTLLKGVTVGDNSIVGINSTLTKSSPSGSITAGNPARIVQKDVTWQHEIDY
ncbi:acyltransferase [Vibrio sp. 10N.261.46.E12]|uniref:acyltransferase n=1 Tax=unclassified Vibrio TaxID=2614977 RepID=UPI001F52D275|nr:MULTISPECIES: acyltransferase [unclassified Vibrio]